MTINIERRTLLKVLGYSSLGSIAPSLSLAQTNTKMLKKPIPSTGETIPVIGMGTWRTFNVGSSENLLAARTEVLQAFFDHGGGVVDSSPMYGSAPDVMGYALKRLDYKGKLFSAEKVWSPAGGTTLEQVDELSARWSIPNFDLVQVHNLTDWQDHLAALQDMKKSGRIRYVGITTSHGRRHSDFEDIMASEDIDFIQLTYNLTNREVERRLLPLAIEKGIAVIANRPYDGGYLIKRLKEKDKIPNWAKSEFDCQNWADFLLKFIISHPALTVAIPATSKVKHMHENMLAGHGPTPSSKTRQRMIQYIESI